MDDLKTLKDLVLRTSPTDDEVVKMVLKQEAIRWVKHWRTIDDHYIKCEVTHARSCDDFQYFFNITEEDLKDD